MVFISAVYNMHINTDIVWKLVCDNLKHRLYNIRNKIYDREHMCFDSENQRELGENSSDGI